MSSSNNPPVTTTPVRCYFVDEAGDGTLFEGKGWVIVGQPGCSRYFILWVLDVPRPDDLGHALSQRPTSQGQGVSPTDLTWVCR
ncbi:MAG: hypothetical protein HYW07_24785 [Candidatus Latescibacteria bacterium]|nr:hypothetical protein [Candidatus Latescibacterota bacterium]